MLISRAQYYLNIMSYGSFLLNTTVQWIARVYTIVFVLEQIIILYNPCGGGE